VAYCDTPEKMYEIWQVVSFRQIFESISEERNTKVAETLDWINDNPRMERKLPPQISFKAHVNSVFYENSMNRVTSFLHHSWLTEMTQDE